MNTYLRYSQNLLAKPGERTLDDGNTVFIIDLFFLKGIAITSMRTDCLKENTKVVWELYIAVTNVF